MDKWAMLCKLKVAAFNDPHWRWERKLDGDRMSALVTTGGHTRLLSRSGVDKTDQFPEIQIAVPADRRPAQFDGEVVSAQGLPFQEFNQRRMNRQKDIAEFAEELPGKFVAFDMLMERGRDMAEQALWDRRRLLEAMPVDKTEQFEDGVAMFERAKAEGWEGVVGKDMRQAYAPGRRLWVKVKVWVGEKGDRHFYVVGFTRGTGKRETFFGAMMLAKSRLEGDIYKFDYVGDVGTGFDDAEFWRLDGLRQRTPAYRGLELGHRIVELYATDMPLEVAVKYVEETNAGSLRFPVYLRQVKG